MDQLGVFTSLLFIHCSSALRVEGTVPSTFNTQGASSNKDAPYFLI